MGRAIRISYRWERTWYISTICAASRILRVVRRVTGEQINGGGRSFRSSSRAGTPGLHEQEQGRWNHKTENRDARKFARERKTSSTSRRREPASRKSKALSIGAAWRNSPEARNFMR